MDSFCLRKLDTNCYPFPPTKKLTITGTVHQLSNILLEVFINTLLATKALLIALYGGVPKRTVYKLPDLVLETGP